jgi:hypothetical protein
MVPIFLRRIFNRITGFSIPPGFGISWSSSRLDADRVRGLLARLGDRRVLFVPYELESPHYAAESVQEIRALLTEELADLDPSSELAKSLLEMRAACREFQTTVDHLRGNADFFPRLYWTEQLTLAITLGKLRTIFGMHIAHLARKHKLDVASELATILPAEPAPEDVAARRHDEIPRNPFDIGELKRVIEIVPPDEDELVPREPPEQPHT